VSCCIAAGTIGPSFSTCSYNGIGTNIGTGTGTTAGEAGIPLQDRQGDSRSSSLPAPLKGQLRCYSRQEGSVASKEVTQFALSLHLQERCIKPCRLKRKMPIHFIVQSSWSVLRRPKAQEGCN